MHHGREADGGEDLNLAVILCKNVLAEFGVAILQSVPYSLYAIGPQSVNELVFPLVATLCYRLVLLVDENGLYTCRSKLDTENGLTLLYGFFCGHIFFINFGS